MTSVGGSRASGRLRLYGTQTGLVYAAEFVADFVTWAQREERYGEWTADQLLRLAAFGFAREAGIKVPVDRNFLGAMKRHPAIVVKSHCRVHDDISGRTRKMTIYRLRPTQGASSPSQETGARLASTEMMGSRSALLGRDGSMT
jgi:hypothetical protein